MDISKLKGFAISDELMLAATIAAAKLKGKTVKVLGHSLDVGIAIERVIADRVVDLHDALELWAFVQSSPATPRPDSPPVPPVLLPPVGPPPIVPHPTEPSTIVAKLESWIDEAWHDWVRNWNAEGSDWAPSGSRYLTAVLSGEANMGPGASVFFFTGISDPSGGPAWVPGADSRVPFVVEHVFTYRGHEFVIPSDAPEETQSWPDLGHVQFGARGWKGTQGWAFVLRLLDPGGSGPGPLTYRARIKGQPGTESKGVTITVAHAGA